MKSYNAFMRRSSEDGYYEVVVSETIDGITRELNVERFFMKMLAQMCLDMLQHEIERFGHYLGKDGEFVAHK